MFRRLHDRFLVWLWKAIQRRAKVYDWTDYGNHIPRCMGKLHHPSQVCDQDKARCDVGLDLWRRKERIR